MITSTGWWLVPAVVGVVGLAVVVGFLVMGAVLRWRERRGQ